MKNNGKHKIKHFGIDILLDYRDGKLSERQNHEVERHLLNCPICEEALEGLEHYPGSKSFVRDVDALKDRVRNRTAGARLRRNMKQWSVAAAVLLLFSLGGYFLVTGTGVGNEGQLAEKKQEQPKEPSKSEAISETAVDTASEQMEKAAESLATPEVSVDVADEQNIEINKEKPPVAEPEYLAETPVEKDEEIVLEATEAEPVEVAPATAVSERAVTSEKKAISGVVKSVSGEPVPFVNVQVEGEGYGVMTDESGHFKAEVSEGDHRLIFSTIGMQPETLLAESGDTVAVVLSETSIALNAVTVAKSDKSTRNKVNTTEPEPAGGFRKWDKYVRSNLRYPEAASKEGVSGTVEVEFWVHEDGSVTDIRVVKGLGYGCDAEAIRLVREGPKWKPGKTNGEPVTMKRTVRIEFAPSE